MNYTRILLIYFLVMLLLGCNFNQKPVQIAEAGQKFQVPVDLDSLHARIQFDSIFYCDGHGLGYIAEKYDSLDAVKVMAFYSRLKEPINFKGISFLYPIDSIENLAQKRFLEKKWNNHFTFFNRLSSAPYTKGYDGFWEMPINSYLSILLFKSGSVRTLEKSSNPNDSLRTIHMERGVAKYFVVAYVRRYGLGTYGNFECYSLDQGFDCNQ